MTKTPTLKASKEIARRMGLTITRDHDGDYVAYWKGQGVDSDAAYFSNDLSDVLGTAAAMCESMYGLKTIKKGDFLNATLAGYAAAIGDARRACCFPESRVIDAAESSAAPKEAARTIDLTPTWESLIPAFAAIFESGTWEGQQTARQELTRLAQFADSVIAERKAPANPDRYMSPAVTTICDLLESGQSITMGNAVSGEGRLYSDSRAALIVALDALGHSHTFEPDSVDDQNNG